MKRIKWLILIALIIPVFIINCSKEDTDSGIATKDGLSEYSFDGATGTGDISGGSSSGSGSSQGQGNTELTPGKITAGEWNDLVNWVFLKNLGQNTDFTKTITNWNFHFESRYSVEIKDAGGNPLIDCKVQLLDDKKEVIWESRTNHAGKAELWSNLNGDSRQASKIKVVYNITSVELPEIFKYEQGVVKATVPISRSELNNVDICFMVDTTGSMGDEIEFLKTELKDVIKRAKEKLPNSNLQLGAVFYRDHGDAFLTRVSSFSDDIAKTTDFINQQSAGGGGDFEEAVEIALRTTIEQMSWSENAKSRILFIVLDAPPHFTADIVSSIQSGVKKAASMGITLIPVTASGIDKPTEFLMRFMAITTNGTYVFITDHSGIGGDHLEPTIGEYKVEYLNDLLVRLIAENSK